MAASGPCQKAIEGLPSKAWARQTEESLSGILTGLINKIQVESEEIIVRLKHLSSAYSAYESQSTPLFARIMYEIYSRYGVSPFERASNMSDTIILYYFLYRRLSRKPSAYRTEEAMLGLLKKYANVPETTRRRHGWMILTIYGRWECLDLYGCGNPDCPEKEELLRLGEKRKRGVRDPVVEDRLFQWGGASKACTRSVPVSMNLVLAAHEYTCVVPAAGVSPTARRAVNGLIGRLTSSCVRKVHGATWRWRSN